MRFTNTLFMAWVLFLSACASTAPKEVVVEENLVQAPRVVIEVPQEEATESIEPAVSDTQIDQPEPELASLPVNTGDVVASQPPAPALPEGLELAEVIQSTRTQQDVEAVNQQIAMASMQMAINSRSTGPAREEYQVGPGDVLEISVFRIDDLNKTARVTGDGYVLLPLLGAVRVGGHTTQEIQAKLVKKLGEDFLHDPQVTVFISEFRSHQVAVLGAVESPDVYTIQQPRTVLEMLSKAGGLTELAGAKVRVQRTVVEAGVPSARLDVIDIRTLLEGENGEVNFTVGAGDTVMVPKAGTVFVEGAVNKPGAYPLKSNSNVLKALAMAGGARFEAQKNGIQVFRQLSNGETAVYQVDLDHIRESQGRDIVLEDGDIVVVMDSALKKGFAGFWRGFSGIFSVGTSL